MSPPPPLSGQIPLKIVFEMLLYGLGLKSYSYDLAAEGYPFWRFELKKTYGGIIVSQIYNPIFLDPSRILHLISTFNMDSESKSEFSTIIV